MAEKKYMSLERLQEYDALVKQAIDGKSDSGHTHSISNVINLQTTLDGKVPTTRTVNGKALSADITLTASDVGASASGHTHSAYVNQNAFSNVKVGDATIAADTTTDTLTMVAGTGISVSADTTNDKVTITNSGVRSISTGGTNGTISVNTNGSSANVAVKGLGSAAYTASTAYDAAGTATTKADAALASAKSYTDGKISDLLDGADDATLDSIKELADAIKTNDSAIDALNTVAAGKANATHSHAIADVSGLQSALDGKAASSHGTHVSFDSTNKPKMDGTAAFGTSTKVARADHVHPTDTSRASKTEFDTHVADTTKHITSTERTNWGTAYTHSQAAHAPSNAQANQNAFSNIAVSGQTTVAADTTTDTVTFAGSNVSITTDATNDKVTFSVANGSTSAKGVVQLTNSTSSTSTTTAATPSSVKSAYDLANTAKINAATAQTKADSAYTLAEGKVDSLSDLGVTATATELNYVDGVTSGIQAQLDGKAASSHTHTISNITNLQTTLNGKAPTSHASSATTYGIGTSSNYGHVKLSDSTSSTSSTSAGIAATPAAVKAAYDKANHSHPYLSTSGGTISGVITTTDGGAFNRDVTTSGTFYYGGTNFNDGAFLGLYGKDQSNYAGQFRLLANNGENFVYLEGMPSGQLRWNNKTVATLGTNSALAIADGGTGMRSDPSMLVNLASTSAAGVFATSPRPGVTGTLPIANGGTSATDKVTAGKNLCETGNWTPTLIGYAGTNPTYTTAKGYNGGTGRAYGYYVRIGRLIFVHCSISCQISNAGTGYACVGGLPYAPALNSPLTLNETYNCVTISSELEKPTLRVLTEGVLIKFPNGSDTYKWKANNNAGGCLLSFSGVYTTDA